MSGAWTFTGQIAPLGGSGETVNLVEETTFCVSDRAGDIHPRSAQGLLFLDTRFVSTLLLRIDGEAVEPLGTSIDEPFRATFYGRITPAGTDGDSPLVVTRERVIGRGLVDTFEVHNHGPEPRAVRIEVVLATDFADLFEVKEQRPTASRGTRVEAVASALRLDGRRDGLPRWTAARATPDADAHLAGEGGAFSWEVTLEPQGGFTACVEVVGGVDDAPVEPRHRCGAGRGSSDPGRRLGAWRAAVPRVRSSDERLAEAVRRGVEDLGALRIQDPDHPEDTVVAAGAPWFMTLFGRDSLLAGYMALIVDPSLALGALRTLARLQGTVEDPTTEEQPGRIMHEIRFTDRPSWRFADGSRYYGSVDATPLFVVLLGELRRWGLAAAEVDALLPAADAALEWIARDGDRDGDGFVEYQRLDPSGLANQGWKDSWDAVRFADGRLAEGPIALAEVQGYVYSAYLARAHFADQLGDAATSRVFRRRAEDLKQAFNERFWLDDAGFYALALDGRKQPVDALASNMGHCLWSGIVEPERAAAVADQLLSPELFSGWGVRTLATTARAYNPVSYHNGSVWPHDNAIIVAGLMRYGLVEHARRIVDGLLEVSTHLDGRLPELLAGADRASVAEPAVYPTSCIPQAWAAATPLLLLRSLLRLDPWAPHDELWLAPALEGDEELEIARIPLSGTRIDIRATATTCAIDGLPQRVTVHREPRRP